MGKVIQKVLDIESEFDLNIVVNGTGVINFDGGKKITLEGFSNSGPFEEKPVVYIQGTSEDSVINVESEGAYLIDVSEGKGKVTVGDGLDWIVLGENDTKLSVSDTSIALNGDVRNYTNGFTLEPYKPLLKYEMDGNDLIVYFEEDTFAIKLNNFSNGDYGINLSGPVNIVVPETLFSDVDGDTLTLSATLADGSELPTWLSFDGNTQTFSGTPPQDFNGDINLRVTASDGDLEVSEDFSLTINSVNDAPVAAND